MLNDPGPLAQNSATFLSGTCKASYDEIICRFTENSNRRSHSYDARIIRHMGLLRPGPKVTAGARRGSDKRVLWSSGSLLHPPFKPPWHLILNPLSRPLKYEDLSYRLAELGNPGLMTSAVISNLKAGWNLGMWDRLQDQNGVGFLANDSMISVPWGLIQRWGISNILSAECARLYCVIWTFSLPTPSQSASFIAFRVVSWTSCRYWDSG